MSLNITIFVFAGDPSLLDLPYYCLLSIIRYTGPLITIIRKISPVCRLLYDVCHDPSIWRVWSLTNVGCVTYNKNTLRSIFRHAEHYRYFYFGGNYVRLTSRDVEMCLALCHNLTSLDIGTHGLLVNAMFVMYMPKLERLILDYCVQLDITSLKAALAKSKQIQILSMFKCVVTLDDIIEITHMLPSLNSLNIERTEALDHDQLSLVITPNLRQIQVSPKHFNGSVWLRFMKEHPSFFLV